MPKAVPTHAPVSNDHLNGLRAKMRGVALVPSDDSYEAARVIHNAMFDRRPAVIARCSGVADVRHALEFAVERSLPVSIRGGGHGVPGFAVCDAGMMLDLSGMTAVRVDPSAKTADAQGGTTWGQFDHETQAFGLATTGGLVRATGIAGLTLAGGHGFLARRFGLACDNLLSVDVLTADGTLLTANRQQHPDLFWALRGGGGNFGVVTSFGYQLHEVGPVLGGLLVFPFDRARELLRAYDEFTTTAPDELGSLGVLGTLPDGTKAFINLLCYSGDLRAGEEVLHPLRTFGATMLDQVQVMPYTAVQSIVENFNPRGLRNYWKSLYLGHLDAEPAAVLVDHYARVPSGYSHVVVYTLGGAVSRVPEIDTAVAHRDARHVLVAIGMWDDPAADAANIAWVRECAEAMQPFALGGAFYPNYEQHAPADRLLAAFGAETYRRLATVKRTYDPRNVFCLNQNIAPAEV
jgi:FAD/FMN-containing dehydrogenase